MRLKLVPDETSIDFLGLRRWTVGASALAAALSLVFLLVFGLNFGIDFRGGSMIMAETDAPADIAAYRAALSPLNLGEVTVTGISDPAAELTGTPRNAVMIRIVAQGDEALEADAVNLATAALQSEIDGVRILSTDSVGAKVSGELVWAGALALALAVAAVLFYIWIRFEWQFALGAVAALVHDVVLTLGLFALIQLEFNLSIIAALLTIIGYSLNDTVVVFDRVREDLRRYKTRPLVEVLNLSVNQTLSRTLMTSATTLIALIALYVLGGEVIRGFTFAMIWGIVVGTYSSIFVAAVVLLRLGVARDTGEAAPSGGVRFGAPDAP
ncbi:MAG: protein translocase subunit SecF [Rhodobacteraceae bacterium]|nr:MAG: protein translocase subunit SecF [Paracoccaceae bacterium]